MELEYITRIRRVFFPDCPYFLDLPGNNSNACSNKSRDIIMIEVTHETKLAISMYLAEARRDGILITECQEKLDKYWTEAKATVNDNYSFKIDYGQRTSYR